MVCLPFPNGRSIVVLTTLIWSTFIYFWGLIPTENWQNCVVVPLTLWKSNVAIEGPSSYGVYNAKNSHWLIGSLYFGPTREEIDEKEPSPFGKRKTTHLPKYIYIYIIIPNSCWCVFFLHMHNSSIMLSLSWWSRVNFSVRATQRNLILPHVQGCHDGWPRRWSRWLGILFIQAMKDSGRNSCDYLLVILN